MKNATPACPRDEHHGALPAKYARLTSPRMNPNRLPHLAAVAPGLVLFPNAGCAAREKPASDAPSSAGVAVPAPASAVATADRQDEAAAMWSDIEFSTYDTRPAFFAGLKRLEARVDDQIRQLNAKRAVMDKNSVDVTDWDIAMNGLKEAQSYLVGVGNELNKASRETWDQQKAKVGDAWVRTQKAYDKVKASTTS